MKKLILLWLLLPILLFSCKKAEETIKLTEEFNDKMPQKDYTQFAGYTDYLTLPDFLSEQQADLYKKAAILHYIFTCAPPELDKIPDDDPGVPQTQTESDEKYIKSTGRYKKYADFEELCLSIFTREFFEELNKNGQFAKNGDDLYILQETEIVQMSLAYAPWHEPDKVELISASDTEIKFKATGYYFENPVEMKGEMTSLTVEIILTQTEIGWRFSQFSTAGNPYIINNN